jgi:acyl-[acyl-carrier-protein] desaturase
MTTGYATGLPNPIALFAYTSAQELATRVSHRNAGRITDDPVAYEIMSRIAVDENHHFMFYRGAVTAMLAENPSLVLPEIYRVLSNFEMPGVGMPKYMRRAIQMAKAGVYNMRIHHDRVLIPLIRDWKIESLEGLTTKAQEFQEKIMGVPALANLQAESFEKRYGLAT